MLILCWSHKHHNVEGPKLPGGSADKSDNLNRKTNQSVSKLQKTNPDTVTEYRNSGMILHIYSDTSYISEPEARSRSGGYFYLGPKSNTPIQDTPPENGTVNVECSIMRTVMASATEAELGGLF